MEQWISKYKKMSRFHKILLWVSCCFIAYTIIGFFIVPPVARHIATRKLSEILDRRVSIEKIKLNPLILKLSVMGFSIREKGKDTDFVSFSRFDVNLQANSLFKWAPVIKEVTLEAPYARVVRQADGGFNFSDILERNKPAAAVPEVRAESKPFHFAVYNIEILNGHADIVDETVGKSHRISDLSLGIPFISNLDEEINIFVEPYFKAHFNDTPIVLTGQTKPFHDSLETSLNFDFKQVDLPYYFAYVPAKSNISLASGTLDAAGGFYFLQKSGKAPTVAAEGELTLANLSLQDTRGNPILNVPKFFARLARSNLLDNDIHMETIEVIRPEVGISRGADRTVNVYTLVPEQPGQKPVADAKPTDEGSPSNLKLKLDEFSISQARVYLRDFYQAPGADSPETSDILKLDEVTLKNLAVTAEQKTVALGEAKITGGDIIVRRQPSGEFNFQAVLPISEVNEASAGDADRTAVPTKESDPWIIELNTVAVDRLNILGQSLARKDEGDLSINGIQIAGENISTRKDSKGKLHFSCTVNQAAVIDINSRVQITPVAVESDLEIKDVQLAWAQPFIKDRLNLILSSGKWGTHGRVVATLDEKSNPHLSFNGGMAVDGLLVYDASGKDKLLQWQKLDIEQVDAGYPDPHATVAVVKLNQLNSHLVRNPDGSLNLANIVPVQEKTGQSGSVADQTKTDDSEKKAEDVLVNVNQFRVENSKIRFTDRSLSPFYDTAINDIRITVKGLSSKKDQRADVEVSAKVDGHAPFSVKGQLNPLSKELFADLDVQFQNMELSPVSPYSGKYVGNKIRKGKLSFELGYLINGSKLDASNLVHIDQIELGDKVNSPDATSLPVGLGIALLKDRSGRIDLNIPVQGDLNDPEFSLGGTIMKVIANLLVKAATSPFALLGSMFGGGEDINLIYFQPGSADAGETETPKLDTIITALYERPSLNLEIRGYSDGEADRKALVEGRFNTLLASEKIKKEDKNSDAAQVGTQMELTSEEYEKYLKKIYKETKKELKKSEEFKEPDEVTPEFMADLVKAQIKVSDEDLKLLASQRALSVKDYLLASEKIKAQRIFIVEPDSLSPSSEGGVKSRVELGIK